jgi:hypothetical protein
MTPFPNFLPAVGTASAATDLANQLGNVFHAADGKSYRLVKASAAMAACASLAVATEVSSGAPTWVVNFPGQSGASIYAPVGIIPVGQVGSTGTTGLLAGDYFLVQIGGVTKHITASSVALGDAIGATGTAGKGDNTTTLGLVYAVALEAATAADTAVDVRLAFIA